MAVKFRQFFFGLFFFLFPFSGARDLVCYPGAFLLLLLLSFLKIFVYMRVYATWMGTEGSRSPKVGVKGCELPSVGAGN